MCLVSSSDEGHAASLRTADQNMTLEEPSQLLHLLRTRVKSTRALSPYAGFVGQLLMGEMKFAAGTASTAAYQGQNLQKTGSRLSPRERCTKMRLFAGSLEVFLSTNQMAPFFRTGSEFLRKLKVNMRKQFDIA